MPAATLAPLAAVTCDACGSPVLRVLSAARTFVTLDAEPVPCGLYELAGGVAQRRGLVELYAARREHRDAAGYDPHDCTPVAWYDRD